MKRILYRVTGWAAGKTCRWSARLQWGWLYGVSCWFAGKHCDIAIRNGFWKINPACDGQNDEPKYIDA